VWFILLGVYNIHIFFLVLRLWIPIYHGYKTSGWRGVGLMVFLHVMSNHRDAHQGGNGNGNGNGNGQGQGQGEYATEKAGSSPKQPPTPLFIIVSAWFVTTFMSNWVLALAAGGNWGFPRAREGGEVVVVGYWLYLWASQATLFAM
jgi:hypothetical protein